MSKNYCPECGEGNSAGNKFCVGCGSPFGSNVKASVTSPNKPTAISNRETSTTTRKPVPSSRKFSRRPKDEEEYREDYDLEALSENLSCSFKGTNKQKTTLGSLYNSQIVGQRSPRQTKKISKKAFLEQFRREGGSDRDGIEIGGE